MRHITFYFAAVVALCAATAGAQFSSSSSSMMMYYERLEIKVGEKAPPLTGLNWVQGQEFDFEPGRVAVVILWETRSSSPSRNAIPSLIQQWNRYKDKNVSFVCISKEPTSTVDAFIKTHASTVLFPLAIGAWTTRQEAERTTYSVYYRTYEIGASNLPYAYIVDADGKFAWRGNPLDRGFQTGIDQAIVERDKNYVMRRAPDGKAVWAKRDSAAATTPSGAAAPATDKTWQHPLFPWNATSENNDNLRKFLASAAQSTDKLGRITAMGVGGEFGDYTLVLYRGVIASIEKTYRTLGDNPDPNLTTLQEALAASGFGWKNGVLTLERQAGMDGGVVYSGSASGLTFKSSLSQENNGVVITLTGHWAGIERRLTHAIIKYEHVSRRDALKQIEDEAKPKPPAIKL